jgi:uncharacterized Zn-binding protein involved in type VI secretion
LSDATLVDFRVTKRQTITQRALKHVDSHSPNIVGRMAPLTLKECSDAFPGKRPVRLGDHTTHGGIVTSAQTQFNIDGKPVAGLGDRVDCPQCGLTTITQADPTWPLGGTHVALHGHETSCGATLIASLPA